MMDNKRKKTILAILIAIALIVALGFFLSAHLKNSPDPDIVIDKNVALIDGIERERISGGDNPQSTKNDIITQKNHGGDIYYVVKIRYVDHSIPKALIYLGRVSNKNEEFPFERVSPHFIIPADEMNDEGISMDTNVEVEFRHESSGLYITVGRLFDNTYKPFYNNEEIPVDEHGFYGIINENEHPKITLKKENSTSS